MSKVRSEAAKVDRLSRLPPELLSSIFDLAYKSSHLDFGPLSKTLFPYWLRWHYRTIRLDSSSALSNFFTIVQDPSRAVLVQKLALYPEASEEFPNERVKSLLRLLPSLRFLDLLTVPPLSQLIPEGQLRNLRRLSYSTTKLRSEDLEVLSRLGSLKRVDLDLSQCYEPEPQRFAPVVPQVEEISVRVDERDSSWSASMGRYVDRFSKVKILYLHDDHHPAFTTFLLNLEHATRSLEKLSLEKLQDLGEDLNIACDHILPRFSNLKHLALDDNTISASLPIYLRQLHHLSTLYLGQDTQYDGPGLQDVLSLIQGPNRIVTLKSLTLDNIYAMAGKRVDYEYAGREQNAEQIEYGMQLDGWTSPGWGDWDTSELPLLLRAGKENGVDVSGSIFEASEIEEAMRLERANRLIKMAYRNKSLEEYMTEKVDAYYRLPDIDVQRIDIKNAKLVKIDLPEEGWFQFTLE
ncbi:hypothetical protein JCM3765_001600 [Sporobolomyces pararoseus]